MTDDALKTILAALPGVDADQISISSDGSAVTVGLREEQWEEALRENGWYIRQAAMTTGITIHVELAKDKH